jgi:hypothetical protein
MKYNLNIYCYRNLPFELDVVNDNKIVHHYSYNDFPLLLEYLMESYQDTSSEKRIQMLGDPSYIKEVVSYFPQSILNMM